MMSESVRLSEKVSFDLDEGVLLTASSSGSEELEPTLEFLNKLVNNFDLNTDGDDAETKAKKWGIVASLYGEQGEQPLYGFEYEGMEIVNPYLNENSMGKVEPKSYYGEAYNGWLARFEHDVEHFAWPMLEGFEDYSYQHDAAPSIGHKEKDIQIFVFEPNPQDREEADIKRFVVIKASLYGEHDNFLFETESYIELLDFIFSRKAV